MISTLFNVNYIHAYRAAHWAVVVGCEEEAMSETGDSFITDLAVAVGASQLMAGGLSASEYASKYNRLSEIGREDQELLYSFPGRSFRR